MLLRNDILDSSPVVTLSTTDNFKTLKFHREARPKQNRLQTITQVLSVEHTYECIEHLPEDGSPYRFDISAPALDLLSRTLPLLSRLVLDLGMFIGYSSSWDQAYKKATEKNTKYSWAPLSRVDGLDVICAIARFENLRNLTLHYKLQQDQIALMHPTPGCEAVSELFESIQRRKRGQVLVRLNVVFYSRSFMMFGFVNHSSQIDPPTVSITMTIVNNDSSSQGAKQPRYICTCENPFYATVIESRKRVERLYGQQAWKYPLGSVQWKLLHGTYSAFPWQHAVMHSFMWWALFPSRLIFDEGKRVQYEPSLANLEVSCSTDYLNRRTRFRESLFARISPY